MQQFHEFTVDFNIIDLQTSFLEFRNRVINEKKSARHKVQLICVDFLLGVEWWCQQ